MVERTSVKLARSISIQNLKPAFYLLSKGTIKDMKRVHTHTRARTHAHTHIHTHARTHARTHKHTHAHTHARTHTHAHTCTHTRTHARTHTHRLNLLLVVLHPHSHHQAYSVGGVLITKSNKKFALNKIPSSA